MIKLFHTADLHLKAKDEDSDYSLECLRILIEKANQEEVDAILFAGDIFDKESDLLDREFRERAIEICNQANSPIIYIPGNHENINGDYSKMKILNWGKNIKLYTEISLFKLNDHLEILLIPHKVSYDNFMEWNLNKKSTRFRIALAHGEIPGFTFLGDEEGAGVLNTSIFHHHEVLHVYMGHIHLHNALTVSGVEFFYAGSPRPVRRKEFGLRGYNIIKIEDRVETVRIELPEVGQVVNLELNVLDQNWQSEFDELKLKLTKNDRLRATLRGLVNTDEISQIKEKLLSIEKEFKQIIRRVDIKDEFESLQDFLENPFYRKIYQIWLEKKPKNKEGREYLVWLNMMQSLNFLKEKVSK